MEEELDIIAGLDIGTTDTKIAIAQYSKSTGKLNIITLDLIPSMGVSKSVINNISAISEKIIILINNISKKYNIELNTINLSIKDPNVKNIQHKFVINRNNANQAISVDDIDKLTSDAYDLAVLPGRSILHVNPLSYSLDNEIGVTNPIGRIATHLQAYFNISLGETFILQNLSKCMDKINLNIDEIIFSPIAASSAVLVNEEKEAGAALINLGSETTEITIFHEGILKYVNIIPFGSNLITKDVAEALQILPKQAEQIKLEYGSAVALINTDSKIPISNIRGEILKTIPAKDLNYIVQVRIEEIFECIIEEIKNAKGASKLLGGIIFVGGGAKLKNLCKLANHMFNMPVRIGNPGEHISKSHKDKIIDPIFATSIGLIIRNKNNIKNQVTVSKVQEGLKRKSGNWFEKIIKKTLIADLLNNDIKDKDFIK